jgi:hypothetical protein
MKFVVATTVPDVPSPIQRDLAKQYYVQQQLIKKYPVQKLKKLNLFINDILEIRAKNNNNDQERQRRERVHEKRNGYSGERSTRRDT